ncbi:MAG: ribbon-helix-helix domain-containing protein [Candidatus Woesearchaeota archaeon]|nr:ribbon-helix-helix domain-containing protein [Candidatus Woesearchaeota archaeon]
MDSISLKLDDSFSQEMEQFMKKHRYTTKTEFIREAIRDKMRVLEKEEILRRLNSVYGKSKRKTTDKQLKVAREKAVAELEKEFG